MGPKIASLLAALSVFLLYIGLVGLLTRSKVKEVVERASGRRKRLLHYLEVAGERLIRLPLLRDVVDYKTTGMQLRISGIGLSVAEFYGAGAVSSAAGILLAVLVRHALPHNSPASAMATAAITASAALVGFVLPKAYLNNRAHKKQLKLNRDLIRFCEKLLIGISAGFDFYNTLKRVSGGMDYLSKEIEVFLEEIEAAAPIEEALDNFAKRLNIETAYTLVSLVKNPIMFGVSFSEGLGRLVEDLRRKRDFKIEEISRKMEAKLIIPIVLTVMPAAAALILIPIALYIARAFI